MKLVSVREHMVSPKAFVIGPDYLPMPLRQVDTVIDEKVFTPLVLEMLPTDLKYKTGTAINCLFGVHRA